MRSSQLASSALIGLLSGCTPDFIAVEVLPPRSGTCAAPALKAPALGRGLFDLEASRERNGAYVADLRVSSSSDVVIDGVRISYVLPDGSSAKSAAEKAADEAPVVGDVVLDGSDDDELRRAIVEDVVLIPRDLAIALRDDEDLSADDTEFAILAVELSAIAAEGQTSAAGDEEDDGRAMSSFAIELCRGCLAVEPSEEECPDGVVQQPVCRPGQEDEMFACAAPATGGLP